MSELCSANEVPAEEAYKCDYMIHDAIGATMKQLTQQLIALLVDQNQQQHCDPHDYGDDSTESDDAMLIHHCSNLFKVPMQQYIGEDLFD